MSARSRILDQLSVAHKSGRVGDAWARIRTWEPLREGILSPSPLTRLGYPRAAAQRPRSVKPFPSHGASVTPPEAFSCRPASGPRRRRPWCSTSRRDSSTKLRAASTRTRSGGKRPPGSPRRSSSRAPIGTRRSSSTFRPAGSRSTKSRLTSPRISSSKEPTRRGRSSGKARRISRGSCWAGESDSEARCRRSWPSWAPWAASPNSRNRSRRSSSGRPGRDHGDQEATRFEEAEERGGRDEEHGPGRRSDESDVVGTGDEEMANESVHERSAHEDREERRRERRIESQDHEGPEGADQDDAQDECEIEADGYNLKREVCRSVHQRHEEMGQHEADQIPVETLHLS